MNSDAARAAKDLRSCVPLENTQTQLVRNAVAANLRDSSRYLAWSVCEGRYKFSVRLKILVQ